MKRFYFPLDGLARVRKHDESSALSDYQTALARLSSAKEVAAHLKQRLMSEWRDYQERIQQPPRPAALIQHQQGWAYIEEQIQTAEQAIVDAEEDVTRAESCLTQRRQARESLENYRDDQYETFRKEHSRLEQMALDELSSRSAITRGSSDEKTSHL